MSEITKAENIRQDLKLELQKLDLPLVFSNELDKIF
jgi:hypothetical protein